MSVRNLDKMFEPQSIALIGATSRPGSVGAVVARNLRRAGICRELTLVRPAAPRRSMGSSVYANVARPPARPGPGRHRHALETVAPSRCSRATGSSAAFLTRACQSSSPPASAGLGETSRPVRCSRAACWTPQNPILLRIVGPSCVGIMVPRVGLDATFIPPGGAGWGRQPLSRQSGAMITAMLDWAVPRGIGFFARRLAGRTWRMSILATCSGSSRRGPASPALIPAVRRRRPETGVIG